MFKIRNRITKLPFTCSKSRIETLEKDMKYVQSYQQKYKKAVLLFLLLTLNIVHTFFRCFLILGEASVLLSQCFFSEVPISRYKKF